MSSPVSRVVFGVPGIFNPHDAVMVQEAIYTGEVGFIPTFSISLKVVGQLDQNTLNLPAWPGAQAIVQFFTHSRDTKSFFWAGAIESISVENGLNTGSIVGLNLQLSGWPSNVGAVTYASRYQFFQDQSSTVIAKNIFERAGGNLVDNIENIPRSREYEVQYGESDKDFMRRILIEDRMLFGMPIKLGTTAFPSSRISLDCEVYENLLGFPRAPDEVYELPVISITEGVNSSNLIGVYGLHLELHSPLTTVAVVTATSKQPTIDMRAKQILDSASAGRIPGCPPYGNDLSNTMHQLISEKVDQRYSTIGEGETLAGDLISSSAAVKLQFSCDTPGLDIQRYFRLNQSGNYSGRSTNIAITKTIQSLKYNSAIMGWEYSGFFSGYTPHNLAYPLPTLPTRMAPGVLRGVVINGSSLPSYASASEDSESYTDEYGRLMVRILWDSNVQRGEYSAPHLDSTVWLRQSTPWAGHKAGFLATPKIGQEVMIGFINNNVNNPVILGCLYSDGINSGSLPPWDPAQDEWAGFGMRSKKDGEVPSYVRINTNLANSSGTGIDISSATDIRLKTIRSLIMESKETEITASTTVTMKAKNLTFNGSKISVNPNGPGENVKVYTTNDVTANTAITKYGVTSSIAGMGATIALSNNFVVGNQVQVVGMQEQLIGAQVQKLGAQVQYLGNQVQSVGTKHENFGALMSSTFACLRDNSTLIEKNNVRLGLGEIEVNQSKLVII